MEGCLVLIQDWRARYSALDFRCAHLCPLLTPKRIMPWSCSSDASVSVWMFIKNFFKPFWVYSSAATSPVCHSSTFFFFFFCIHPHCQLVFFDYYPLFWGQMLHFFFFFALSDEGEACWSCSQLCDRKKWLIPVGIELSSILQVTSLGLRLRALSWFNSFH